MLIKEYFEYSDIYLQDPHLEIQRQHKQDEKVK